MQRQRLGELLKRLVPLSSHDVDEILHEQRDSHRMFGETAISMGLCQPEHVWRAWCGQISDEVVHVDLDEVGIDAQATHLLPREVAMRLAVIPVRVASGVLVVATSERHFESASVSLPPLISMQLKFIIAPHEQVVRALSMYYETAGAS